MNKIPPNIIRAGFAAAIVALVTAAAPARAIGFKNCTASTIEIRLQTAPATAKAGSGITQRLPASGYVEIDVQRDRIAARIFDVTSFTTLRIGPQSLDGSASYAINVRQGRWTIRPGLSCGPTG